MTHGTNTLRLVLMGAIATLAIGAPTASAQQPAGGDDVQVCNQATPHSLGGELVATDGDPTPPARYQEDLRAHPGKGAGLVNAASHSPALSLCDPAAPTTDGGDGEQGPDDPDLPSVDS